MRATFHMHERSEDNREWVEYGFQRGKDFFSYSTLDSHDSKVDFFRKLSESSMIVHFGGWARYRQRSYSSSSRRAPGPGTKNWENRNPMIPIGDRLRVLPSFDFCSWLSEVRGAGNRLTVDRLTLGVPGFDSTDIKQVTQMIHTTFTDALERGTVTLFNTKYNRRQEYDVSQAGLANMFDIDGLLAQVQSAAALLAKSASAEDALNQYDALNRFRDALEFHAPKRA